MCFSVCSSPPTDRNVIKPPQNPPYSIGTSVTYSCRSGYFLFGSRSLTSTCSPVAASTPQWSLTVEPGLCQASKCLNFYAILP